MCFVTDEPHGKNVAQRNRNQIGTLLNQQFQAIRKVLKARLVSEAGKV